VRSIKIMLLGISMMIFAGIFIAYPMGSLGGAEFFYSSQDFLFRSLVLSMKEKKVISLLR
jgi:hypothetical protein